MSAGGIDLTTELTCDAGSEKTWRVSRTRDYCRDRVPCSTAVWPGIVKKAKCCVSLNSRCRNYRVGGSFLTITSVDSAKDLNGMRCSVWEYAACANIVPSRYSKHFVKESSVLPVESFEFACDEVRHDISGMAYIVW